MPCLCLPSSHCKNVTVVTFLILLFQRILTPTQTAKFVLWVQKNEACVHMLNQLWDKLHGDSSPGSWYWSWRVVFSPSRVLTFCCVSNEQVWWRSLETQLLDNTDSYALYGQYVKCRPYARKTQKKGENGTAAPFIAPCLCSGEKLGELNSELENGCRRV